MSRTPIEEHDAPEVIVKNFIRDQWNSTNTLGVTPRIHLGWLDEEYNRPEVTVSNPDENTNNVPNAGSTGYVAINPADGNPHVDVLGTLHVNSWSDRPRAETVADSTPSGDPPNPRQFVFLCKLEVQRIIQANARGGDSSLSFLSYARSQAFVDDERDDTMFRRQVWVGYGYDY